MVGGADGSEPPASLERGDADSQGLEQTSDTNENGKSGSGDLARDAVKDKTDDGGYVAPSMESPRGRRSPSRRRSTSRRRYRSNRSRSPGGERRERRSRYDSRERSNYHDDRERRDRRREHDRDSRRRRSPERGQSGRNRSSDRGERNAKSVEISIRGRSGKENGSNDSGGDKPRSVLDRLKDNRGDAAQRNGSQSPKRSGSRRRGRR
ncbi:hypothetical protein FBU59_000803, partial [Linderina macrospora]